MMLSHFAVIHFTGDPCDEHPDEERRGEPPGLTLIAAGPEDFCWGALEKWTEKYPLRQWESAEVLQRDPSTIDAPLNMKEH